MTHHLFLCGPEAKSIFPPLVKEKHKGRLFHDMWKLHEITISVPINSDVLNTTCPFVYVLPTQCWRCADTHRRPQLHWTWSPPTQPHTVNLGDSPRAASWEAHTLTFLDFFFPITSGIPIISKEEKSVVICVAIQKSVVVWRHGSVDYLVSSFMARHCVSYTVTTYPC